MSYSHFNKDELAFLLSNDKGHGSLCLALSFLKRGLDVSDWYLLLLGLFEFPKEAWLLANIDSDLVDIPTQNLEFVQIVEMLYRPNSLNDDALIRLRKFLLTDVGPCSFGLISLIVAQLAQRAILEPTSLFPETLLLELIEREDTRNIEEIIRALTTWRADTISNDTFSRLSKIKSFRVALFAKLNQFLNEDSTVQMIAELNSEFLQWANLDNSMHQILVSDLASICRGRRNSSAVKLFVDVCLQTEDVRDIHLLMALLQHPEDDSDNVRIQRISLCANSLASKLAAGLIERRR